MSKRLSLIFEDGYELINNTVSDLNKFIIMTVGEGEHIYKINLPKERGVRSENAIAGLNHFASFLHHSGVFDEHVKREINNTMIRIANYIPNIDYNRAIIDEREDHCVNEATAKLNVYNRCFEYILKNEVLLDTIVTYVQHTSIHNLEPIDANSGVSDDIVKLREVDIFVLSVVSVYSSILNLYRKSIGKPSLGVVRNLVSDIESRLHRRSIYFNTDSVLDNLVLFMGTNISLEAKREATTEYLDKWTLHGNTEYSLSDQVIKEFLVTTVVTYHPVYDIQRDDEELTSDDIKKMNKTDLEALKSVNGDKLEMCTYYHWEKFKYVDKNMAGMIRIFVKHQFSNLVIKYNPKTITRSYGGEATDADGTTSADRFQLQLAQKNPEQYAELTEIAEEIVDDMFEELSESAKGCIPLVNIRENVLSRFLIGDLLMREYSISRVEIFTNSQLAIIGAYIIDKYTSLKNLTLSMMCVPTVSYKVVDIEDFYQTAAYKANTKSFINNLNNMLGHDYGDINILAIKQELLSYMMDMKIIRK